MSKRPFAFISTSTAVALAALAGHPVLSQAATLYVATTGSDTNPGTLASPWRTIQHAANSIVAGDTIYVRGGTYKESVTLGVSGSASAGFVTLQSYPGETAILDGTGLAVPGETGLINIIDQSYIKVVGLELRNWSSSSTSKVPVGIWITGGGSNLQILNNHIHDIKNSAKGCDANALGLAVYGSNPSTPLSNVTIDGNQLDHLTLGCSESLAVDGNVQNWSVTHNVIHDNNNIGIDAIGFEPTLTGKYRYTQRNRARNGTIAGNTVSRIRSRGNPAYWEDGQWCNCADGIYVDGGAHIKILRNRVRGSDIGIEVAAENARGRADHVLVHRNVVTGSLFTGITTGGYCNGAEDCGAVRTGASRHNTFTGNVLRGNNRLDDGSPEILQQYHVFDAVFAGNSVTATNSGHVLYGTVPGADGARNRSDHNRFRTVGGSRSTAEFGWAGAVYKGFDAYRAATGQDAHSTFRTG
jgi:hypothetical protein